jgi:hypothetical protein
MRKLLLVLFLGAILSPLSLLAGNTGTLKGRVVLESQNNAPAAGALIKVLGTTSGAKSKPDGKFTVMSVPAGSFDVIVTYMKDTTRLKVTISADKIEDLGDIAVREKETTTETIIVTGKKTDRSATSETRKTSAQLQNNVSNDIMGAISQGNGVQKSGDGVVIRNSRTNETSYRMDNVEISNPLSGSFGSSYYPMPSTFAAAEVQVQTGAFSAEYGSAMGGVVNTSMKTGRNDKYEGNIKWRTDVPALWGSQGKKLRLVEKDGILKAENAGKGYDLEGSKENSIEFGLGGPIPLTDGKGTFFLSSSYKKEGNSNNNYAVKDPLGNNLGALDNNSAWVKRIDSRFKYDITDKISATFGASYGISSVESGSWAWLYSNSKNVDVNKGTYNIGNMVGDFAGKREGFAKQNVSNMQVLNLIARIKQVFETSWYQVTLTYNENNDQTGRRKNTDDPSFFSGYEILEPQDEYMLVEGRTFVKGFDKILDQYSMFKKTGRTADGYLEGEMNDINPLTGFMEGQEYVTTNNPYGLYYQDLFSDHGSNGLQFRKTAYWQIDGIYETMFEHGDGKEKFSHSLKSGVDVRFYNLHRHYNAQPWLDNPNYDVFSDEWGGNLYVKDVQSSYNKSSKPFEPTRIGAFVQDNITYKGVKFNPGIRFDYFDPNSKYRTVTSKFVSYFEIDNPKYFSDVDPKVQVSPRINIAYPITETSTLSIGYGMYMQMPSLQYLYDGFSTGLLKSNSNLGNPNMDAQRTNQYQINYDNDLTDQLKLSISAYYKDIYNQVGTVFVNVSPTPYYQYSTTEYGSSKGIEFTLTAFPTRNIYAEVSYAYSAAVGTSPGPTSNYGLPVDPYTDKQAFPLAEYTLNNNIPHRLNVSLNFMWGNNEGPEVLGVQPLENTQINFQTVYRTGSPYTRLKINGVQLTDYNQATDPDYWNVSMRLIKGFQLKDWFGDAAGNTKLNFFVDVYNLLNRTVVTGLNARTADPDDDGVNFYKKVSEMATNTFYKEANWVLAGTYAASQYDVYGNRFYNANADYDKDGGVNMDEQFISFKRYLTDARSFRTNYQTPRTIYFGISLDF